MQASTAMSRMSRRDILSHDISYVLIVCVTASLLACDKPVRVCGRVVDQDARPIQGVTMTLGPSEPFPSSAITDADGCFSVVRVTGFERHLPFAAAGPAYVKYAGNVPTRLDNRVVIVLPRDSVQSPDATMKEQADTSPCKCASER